MKDTTDPMGTAFEWGLIDGRSFVQMERVQLNVEDLHEERQWLDRFIADRCEVEEIKHRMVREMTVRMRLRIASTPTAKYCVRFPTTWWDAFKVRFMRWMPIWVAKPHFTVIDCTAQRYYPDIKCIPGNDTTFVVRASVVYEAVLTSK